MRGLKHQVVRSGNQYGDVARSTRAWIETAEDTGYSAPLRVARSTRAWIETFVVD